MGNHGLSTLHHDTIVYLTTGRPKPRGGTDDSYKRSERGTPLLQGHNNSQRSHHKGRELREGSRKEQTHCPSERKEKKHRKKGHHRSSRDNPSERTLQGDSDGPVSEMPPRAHSSHEPYPPSPNCRQRNLLLMPAPEGYTQNEDPATQHHLDARLGHQEAEPDRRNPAFSDTEESAQDQMPYTGQTQPMNHRQTNSSLMPGPGGYTQNRHPTAQHHLDTRHGHHLQGAGPGRRNPAFSDIGENTQNQMPYAGQTQPMNPSMERNYQPMQAQGPREVSPLSSQPQVRPMVSSDPGIVRPTFNGGRFPNHIQTQSGMRSIPPHLPSRPDNQQPQPQYYPPPTQNYSPSNPPGFPRMPNYPTSEYDGSDQSMTAYQPSEYDGSDRSMIAYQLLEYDASDLSSMTASLNDC